MKRKKMNMEETEKVARGLTSIKRTWKCKPNKVIMVPSYSPSMTNFIRQLD